MEIRISSGTAKNRKLKAPQIPGIRLAQEVVRQAIFAILADKIENAKCLDLYAGSGSIGLEALSRGASWCDFVDINPQSTQAIEANIKYCRFEANAQVHQVDALKYVSNCEVLYDIIFVDPFYGQVNLKHLFKMLPQILKRDGLLFFLHGKEASVDQIIEDTPFKVTDERKYGASHVSLLELQEEAARSAETAQP